MKSRILFSILFIIQHVVLFSQDEKNILFTRIQEPNEKAFSILVPKNWNYSGGIVRVNPISSGAANAIEAKLDFKICNDKQCQCEIHWLPDIYYYDPSGTMVSGMFPEGSNYNGMLVLYKRKASDFVRYNLIPYLHPNLEKVNIISDHEATGLEVLFRKLDKLPQMGMSYDAYVCDHSYNESGTNYMERILCVLVDMGPHTNGMWKNVNTVYFRTPASEFAKLEPVFSIISQSVILNPKWIQDEINGQIKRGQIMVNTMQEMNSIDQEMQQAHMQTNAEIHHQAFLNLTDQEDYINPYTGQVETGSNQWKHRWVDDLGNVLYTDNSSYNPNLDTDLNMSGFKRSKVK